MVQEKNNHRKKGTFYEEKAQQYLVKKGYKIIACNYSSKYGEIDIIAGLGDVIVFVEVKYRATDEFGLPEEFVTKSKRQKISKTANEYIIQKNILDKEYRFDIISISSNNEIVHFEDAFWG